MNIETKVLLIKSIEKYNAATTEERAAMVAYVKQHLDFRAKAWFEATPEYYAAGAIFLRWLNFQQCRITIKWP